MITVIQVYSIKEQVGQNKTQNVQYEEKRNTRKFTLGAKACARGDKEIKARRRVANTFTY